MIGLVFLARPSWAGEVLSDTLDVAPIADVIILGELHDNPQHHVNQARAVAEIAPKALVFEMLSPEQAANAISAVRGDAETLGLALGWADSGWPEFAMYWPIFAAAPSAAIVGAALPRDQVRRSVMDGAATVFSDIGGNPATFGLDRPLPADEQSAREAMQQEAHCNALPPQMLPGMVDAQRLRDAAFAAAVTQAVGTHGAPVVLITGNGHARRDWGVPAYLAQIAPELDVHILGQFEQVPDPDYAAQFDAWIVTAPADRPDPCAAFRG